MKQKQSQNFGNDDLRSEPAKKVSKIEIAVPGREKQASQQGGAQPQNQK